jgi:copper transport protein
VRLILTALLAFALLGWPPPAQAHASLVASEPADGAHLDAAPTELLLRFDELVMPLSLRVTGPGTGELLLPPPGTFLQAVLPAGLGEGIYVVSWRVVSADGHPVAGAFAFGVGRTEVPAVAPADTSRVAVWASTLMGLRYAFYLAFVVGAGCALFRLLVTEPPRRVRHGIMAAAALGICIAGFSIGCLGGLLAEAPPGGMLLAGIWQLGASTPLATSLSVSASGLVLCGAAALRTGSAARWLGAAGAVVAALGFPLAGHVATAEPRWLAVAALTTHTLAAALWLGAFWPLRVLLAEHGGDAQADVERFSRWALLGRPARGRRHARGAAVALPRGADWERLRPTGPDQVRRLRHPARFRSLEPAATDAGAVRQR